ncbi:hypothetical protein PBY51_006980 [Eleginops maclovinus]|uniref:Uncharacterized protein n=2 Tax=Eleginops maclovinus TaxID=56733 RepID=A0AAN8A5Y8_ELEMC|nr:hypothetical protein PBY51_006980 [Eleginops maclovinus]
MGGKRRERRAEEREGISGMAGAPQCVRVLGPFRQAPAQQGSRDNHAAPDPMHRDGGMEGDEETQRGALRRGVLGQSAPLRKGGGHDKEKRRHVQVEMERAGE